MIVAVVGKGRNASVAACAQAALAGAAVAAAGHTLVTGGLGGCMLAAALGAQRAVPNAVIVGLTPLGRDPDAMFPGLVIPTGLPESVRNVVIGSCCDAMLACHGSHGTLQELAVAIDRGVPVAALDPCWADLPGVEVLSDTDTTAVTGWLQHL